MSKKTILEMKSTCDQYAMKTVKMIANDLEYYISLVDKTTAGFERIDSNSESSTVGKMNQTTSHATEKSSVEGSVDQCSKLYCLILRNCHGHLKLQQLPP